MILAIFTVFPYVPEHGGRISKRKEGREMRNREAYPWDCICLEKDLRRSVVFRNFKHTKILLDTEDVFRYAKIRNAA